MKKYKWTLVGLIFSCSIFLTSLLFNFNYFKFFTCTVRKSENFEIIEFIMPFLLVAAFFILDLLRNRQGQKAELEKLEVYKAMLFTTHHILNNYLNQIQYISLRLEEKHDIDPDIYNIYNKMTKEVLEQIEALEQIEEINPKSIRHSVSQEL